MSAFWIGAAALSAVALAFLLIPLWRERRAAGQWSWTGLAAAVALVPLAFALYLSVRTWEPELLERNADEQRMVAQLAERMAENPDDPEGWRLLGRSYMRIGEYRGARNAFEQAWRRTPEPDNELKLSLAEAQVLIDQSSLEGEAGQMIEQVLQEEPGNPRALWYGGQRAFNLGDAEAARTRLSRLLELGVPDELEQIVRAQLQQLGAAGGEGNAGPGGMAAAQADGDSAADGPSIAIDVRLGDDVSADGLGPEAALFIFARSPDGGPPIAAARAPASEVPGEFVLSDRDAMLPGRSLGDYETLELVARLSGSGQASEQAGDLYGEGVYRAGGGDDRVELVIDQVAQ